MARGLRSTPGRRIRPGADTAAAEAAQEDDGGAGEFGAPERPGDTDGPLIDDEEDDDEDGPGPTSVEDFAREADPGEFDRTFTDDDSPLSIAGNFDPTAGPKQAIPRVAFVLNFNLVYNPERNRWEPDTGNANRGPGFGDIQTLDLSALSSPIQLPEADTLYATNHDGFSSVSDLELPAGSDGDVVGILVDYTNFNNGFINVFHNDRITDGINDSFQSFDSELRSDSIWFQYDETRNTWFTIVNSPP